MKSLVIIPAYNEENNIQHTLADLQSYCPECDCLVVNDCSKDRTREVLQKAGVTFLDLPVNLGIGGGVQAGYLYAERNGYDIAIQFDGDGQHEAKYIPSLIAPLESDKADVVIGSRFVEKKGFQSSVIRRIGIDFLSSLVSVMSGIQVKDVTSGMRAANRKMISFYANKYAQDYPEPEAILQAGLFGARIVEIPVEMRERESGKSSISPMKSIYYMIKVTLALIMSRLFSER